MTVIWAQGVHSSSHKPSGYKCDHIIMDWEVTKTHTYIHTSKHNTTRANTPTLMNECPTDFTLILCFSIAGNFAETVPVSMSVCVCIIKPSSNIYWGQMGGRMLPVSTKGNEGSGEMMKRWGCSAARREHFTYNGKPWVSLCLPLTLWSPLMATEDQRRDADCFQSSLGWSGGGSVQYFAELKRN